MPDRTAHGWGRSVAPGAAPLAAMIACTANLPPIGVDWTQPGMCDARCTSGAPGAEGEIRVNNAQRRRQQSAKNTADQDAQERAERASAEMAELRRQAEAAWARSETATARHDGAAAEGSEGQHDDAAAARRGAAEAIHADMAKARERALEAQAARAANSGPPPKPRTGDA
jgi:hypothetical protein